MNLKWLPFAVSLLPIATVSLCYGLSAADGLIPACIPLLEGCTTVSRAGRYGMAYFLFKGGVIPTAVLLSLFWVLCRRWFLSLGGSDSFGLRAMVWLGIISSIFLILYAVFLGSKGDFYSLMRRFGVTIHFSFGYLSQVLLLNRLWDERRAGRLSLPRYITTAMFTITLLMFVLGLYSIPVGELIPDPDNRTINIIEWNFALLLFAWYLLPGIAWHKSDFRIRFDVRDKYIK
jgi:hypothetical protein